MVHVRKKKSRDHGDMQREYHQNSPATDLPGRILRKRVAERAVVPAFVPGPHCPSHGVFYSLGFFPI